MLTKNRLDARMLHFIALHVGILSRNWFQSYEIACTKELLRFKSAEICRDASQHVTSVCDWQGKNVLKVHRICNACGLCHEQS